MNYTNKQKGEQYEEYIAKHYRTKNYYVIENGKNKGRKDGGIDLIAIKQNQLILIQCKNWNENNSYKITHKDIKVLITETKDFLDKYPKYKNYIIKIRYTLSGNFIDASAKKYILESKENIDYEIIRNVERKIKNKYNYQQNKTNKNTIKLSEKEKIVISFLVIIAIISLISNQNEVPEKNIQNKKTIEKINLIKNEKIIIKKPKKIEIKQISAHKAIEEKIKLYIPNKELSEREKAKAELKRQMSL